MPPHPQYYIARPNGRIIPLALTEEQLPTGDLVVVDTGEPEISTEEAQSSWVCVARDVGERGGRFRVRGGGERERGSGGLAEGRYLLMFLLLGFLCWESEDMAPLGAMLDTLFMVLNNADEEKAQVRGLMGDSKVEIRWVGCRLW